MIISRRLKLKKRKWPSETVSPMTVLAVLLGLKAGRINNTRHFRTTVDKISMGGVLTGDDVTSGLEELASLGTITYTREADTITGEIRE